MAMLGQGLSTLRPGLVQPDTYQGEGGVLFQADLLFTYLVPRGLPISSNCSESCSKQNYRRKLSLLKQSDFPTPDNCRSPGSKQLGRLVSDRPGVQARGGVIVYMWDERLDDVLDYFPLHWPSWPEGEVYCFRGVYCLQVRVTGIASNY